MYANNFQFSFTTSKNTSEVFQHLLNPRNWWVGLFNEVIEGSSAVVNDSFTFKAGDGVHYSNQKLVQLEPNRTIVWLVTESNLSFLTNTNEWAGTKIGFHIEEVGSQTKVTFTHEGLVPDIECYNSCSSAWTQYLQNLASAL